jgi:hypothetical protein
MTPFPAQRKSPIIRLAVAGTMLAWALVSLSACSQSTHSSEALMPGEKPSSKSDPYPDFSKPLSSAMDQMSDEDARKMSSQLSALSVQRRSGAISEAEYWRRVKEMRALNASMPQDETAQ